MACTFWSTLRYVRRSTAGVCGERPPFVGTSDDPRSTRVPEFRFPGRVSRLVYRGRQAPIAGARRDMNAAHGERLEVDMRRPIAPRHWGFLLLAVALIAVLSLGVHDVMLTRLGIPFPDASAVPAWARYVDVTVRVASLVWFCRISRPALGRLSAGQASILMGLCVVFLNETLRVFLVGLYLTHGWSAGGWMFTLLDRLPNALVAFFHGAAAALIARRSRDTDRVRLIAAVVLIAGIGSFALQSTLGAAAVTAERALAVTEPVERYVLPYPLHVYSVIYSTFVEPTIAAFVLAALIWPALSGSRLRRVFIFTGLLLLIRGRVVTELLFSFWLPGPLGAAFLSEGQFFLETVALAMLTGGAWANIDRRRMTAPA